MLLFGRRRTPLVLSAFVAVAMVIVWLRLAGWWFEVPSGAVQTVLGIVIIGGAAVAWKLDRGVTDFAAGAIAGVAGAWTWIPCVGEHLSTVINGANRNPFDHIGGTIAFLTGQFLPFILIAAVGVLLPVLNDKLTDRRVVTAGAIIFGIVGVLFATQIFDDVTSELARRNTL